MRNLTLNELEQKYPKLSPENYVVKSRATARYNCLAFANDDERHWWKAGLHGKRFRWPQKVADTLDGWTEFFIQHGYELTDSRDVEPGFEKIAIYRDLADLVPGHVAKSDGRSWKSKLGKYQDIQHESLDLLEGGQRCEYGIVERILRRPLKFRKGRS